MSTLLQNAFNEEVHALLQDIQIRVESEIAALAAANRTPEELERLEALCGWCEGDNHVATQKWYFDFHNTLAKAAHNEFLERSMATIRGEMFVSVLPEGEQPDREDLAAAHCAVVAAVRDQDSARARTIMKEHHEFLYKFLQTGERE